MPRSWFEVTYLQGSADGGPATANGNGRVGDAGGIDAAQQVEIRETNGGTCTVNLEGAFDAVNGPWYAIGYQQVDALSSLARAIAGIAVAANSSHVYQILDPYPNIRARISAGATSPQVTIKSYYVGS